MGRFDEDPKKVKQNEEIAKRILKINNFIMNPPNKFLKILFLIITWPSRLVHQNSKCAKFIQKHIIILNSRQYLVSMISMMFFLFFILDYITDDSIQKIIISVVIWALALFLGMSVPGKGGGRKDKPDPPHDSTDTRNFDPKEILVP